MILITVLTLFFSLHSGVLTNKLALCWFIKYSDAHACIVCCTHIQMQAVVQKMLHSEHGVPIRSYKRRLISAIPSAFTGTVIEFLVQYVPLCAYY